MLLSHSFLQIALVVYVLATTTVVAQDVCDAWQEENLEVSTNLRLSYRAVEYVSQSLAVFTARLEYAGSAWVSLGWSPNELGKMVGSDAVIGLPSEETSQTNPGKYIMDEEELSGVYLFPNNQQTLMDGDVTQENGITVLTFSKIMSEPNEVEIFAGGNMTFVWAVGLSNALGPHNLNTGSGDFTLTLTPCSSTETLVLPSDPDPTPAPQATPPNPQTEEEDGDGFAVDCSEGFQEIIRLMDGNLEVAYRVTTDEASGEALMTVQMEYAGEAWISLGTAPNSRGDMVGGEAIIGLPADVVSASNPGKYHMTSTLLDGVFPMDAMQQTLIGGDITQEDGRTVLTYTKKLVEEGELELVLNGETTFIWAVGVSNGLNIHLDSGSFARTLSICIDGSTVGVVEGVDVSGRFSFSKRQAMWLAHAYLGFIAWGVFVPLAVSASWLRNLFNGPLWFKVHFYLNALVMWMTIAGFVLAVLLYEDSGAEHFSGTHERIGLTITILVLLQSTAGFLRPSAPKPKAVESADEVEALNKTSTDDHRGLLQKKRVRSAWEVGHKVGGVFILVLGVWQVQDGLVLYATKYDATNYETAFWGYIGGFAALVVLATMRMRDRQLILESQEGMDTTGMLDSTATRSHPPEPSLVFIEKLHVVSPEGAEEHEFQHLAVMR